MQEKEYKVGDYVMVRKDLVGGTGYNFPGSIKASTYFHPLMERFRGHIYKVTEIIGSVVYDGYINYRLSLGDEEYEWVFNSTMLESVSSLRKLVCKRKN